MFYIKEGYKIAKVTNVCVTKIPVLFMKFPNVTFIRRNFTQNRRLCITNSISTSKCTYIYIYIYRDWLV